MKRLDKLKKELTKDEAIFISSPLHIKYLSDYDTSLPSEVGVGNFSDPHGFLLLLNNQNYILVDKRYEGLHIPEFETMILHSEKRHSFLELVVSFIKEAGIKKVYLEKTSLNYLEGSRFIRKLSLLKIKSIELGRPIYELRISKELDEINLIKEAQNITDNTFSKLLEFIKPNMTEDEVSQFIKREILQSNGELAFEPIVASGKHSAIPHHSSSNKRIATGENILLDFGARVKGYHSDMSRTIFIGKPNQEFIKYYDLALNCLQQIEELLDSERVMKTIFERTKELLKDGGSSAYFYYHALGHGVGLEIHEAPGIGNVDRELKPNSIITLEPAFYFKNKFGIRIEDLIWIKDNGIEVLTKSPKELISLN